MLMSIAFFAVRLMYAMFSAIFFCSALKRKNASPFQVILLGGCIFALLCFSIFHSINTPLLVFFLLFSFSLLFHRGTVFEKFLVSLCAVFLLLLLRGLTDLLSDFLFGAESDSSDLREIVVRMVELLLLSVVTAIVAFFREREKPCRAFEGILLSAISFISLTLSATMVYAFLYPKDQTISIFSRTIVYLYTPYVAIGLVSVILLNLSVYLLVFLIHRADRLNEENKNWRRVWKMETDNVQLMRSMSEETQKLRHDMKQVMEQLSVEISSLQGDSEELERLRSLIVEGQERYGGTGFVIQSGNRTLDCILTYKIHAANEQGIQILTNITSPVPIIDDFDLCILVGNLVDNAIENISDKSKPVLVAVERRGLFVRIAVTQPVDITRLQKNPKLMTTKSDKVSHGFGLRRVREIVEKYNGMVRFEGMNNGQFLAEVFLPK